MKCGNEYTMHTWVTLLWLVTCFNGLHTIKIVKLVVPEIIQYGVQDSVILDCDYTYGERTPGFMVKWFFKSKANLVYQWIMSQKPQDVGALRGRVDLNYKASDDPMKMYRAIRIVKIDTDLTGEYICVVSSFIDEDFKSKNMTIFAPERSFHLIQNKTDDDTVNVFCAADGAYPAPSLTIATPEKHLPVVNHRVTAVDGRYSVVASITLNDADLPTPAEFICTLRIPQAKYAVRKEAIYYPGPISTTPVIPNAADMQLATAASFRDTNFYATLLVASLSALDRAMAS